MMIENIFPSCVHKIAILSPAGIPDKEKLNCSIDIIKNWGIDVICGDHCCLREEEYYFAATCEKRAADLNRVLYDSSVDLVLCSRGGYGSASLLPLIDWQQFASRNLPVLGYSDITALHLAMLRYHAGIPVTSPMAQGILEWGQNEFTTSMMRNTLRKVFHLPANFPKIELEIIQSGNAKGIDISGPMTAANLSILTSLCGTPYLPDFRKSILVVEDVGEPPRKIDRFLVQLRLCGILNAISALVFADFTDCGTSEEIARIVQRCARQNPELPIFCGIRFGHTPCSCSFLNGSDVTIHHSNLILS